MAKLENFKGLVVDLTKNASFRRILSEQARDIFTPAKEQMLAEFDNHPVTKEILGGPGAENISGTLNGKGNLFSFIGFPSNSNPIGPVRALLEAVLVENLPKVTFEGDNPVFQYRIKQPTRGQLEAVSPLPFETGRSWLYGIEEGISGFGAYVSKLGVGRSSGGVQYKGDVTGADFKTTPYITEILANFEKRLNNAT